jgi:hypothetical protein
MVIRLGVWGPWIVLSTVQLKMATLAGLRDSMRITTTESVSCRLSGRGALLVEAQPANKLASRMIMICFIFPPCTTIRFRVWRG